MRRIVFVVGLALAAVLVPVPGRAQAYTAGVRADSVLNIRSGPGTDKPLVGSAGNGQGITISCQVWGEEIEGTQRTSPFWNRVGDGQFVSDAYLEWAPSRPEIPWCGRSSGEPTAATISASRVNVRSGPG